MKIELRNYVEKLKRIKILIKNIFEETNLRILKEPFKIIT